MIAERNRRRVARPQSAAGAAPATPSTPPSVPSRSATASTVRKRMRLVAREVGGNRQTDPVGSRFRVLSDEVESGDAHPSGSLDDAR